MFNLQINQPNTIEFIFSNINSIELNLVYIDLIAEKDSEKFKIELHQSNKSRAFKIPADEKEHKIEFEFSYANLESFEIVGKLRTSRKTE